VLSFTALVPKDLGAFRGAAAQATIYLGGRASLSTPAYSCCDAEFAPE
jgi:hypothetical protein